MRVVAVVQARIGSSRLPGKVLRRVGRQTVLTHVLARARAIPGVDEVHVTTTTGPEDDQVAARCRGAGVSWSRGQVPMGRGRNDVLAGYVQAARETRADVVLRITSDCPLLDPAVGGEVLRALRHSGAAYASNVCPPSLYDGCDVEAFTARALQRAARLASEHQREHVTTWLREADGVRRYNVSYAGDWSHVKLSVDTAADLERVRAVWARLPDVWTWRDVVRCYREAYPPRILRRAWRIFGAESGQISQYLHGARTAARDLRLGASSSRASILGYEDVAELGRGLGEDDLQAVEDLLGRE